MVELDLGLFYPYMFNTNANVQWTYEMSIGHMTVHWIQWTTQMFTGHVMSNESNGHTCI